MAELECKYGIVDSQGRLLMYNGDRFGKTGEWEAVKIPQGFEVKVENGLIISKRPDLLAEFYEGIQKEKIETAPVPEGRICFICKDDDGDWLYYVDKI